MELASVLAKMDGFTDHQEILIGIDWLEEQGYVREAAFYRWLVREERTPYHLLFHKAYCWFLHDTTTGVFPQKVKAAPIKDSRLWNDLAFRGNFAWLIADNWIGFNSSAEAMAALRCTWLMVYQ